MSVTVVLDPGSTHMGKMRYAKQLIQIAAKSGADAVKFQLFPNEEKYTRSGNVCLPYEWFPELFHFGVNEGIAVTASVFNREASDVLVRHPVPFVKFAYSQSSRQSEIKALLDMGKRVVVSVDCNNDSELTPHDGLVKLFCQPVYPTMWKTNLEGLFPRFHGISDHSIGHEEACEAVKRGAWWVEKHITIGYGDVTCPDHHFALRPTEVERFVKMVKAAG